MAGDSTVLNVQQFLNEITAFKLCYKLSLRKALHTVSLQKAVSISPYRFLSILCTTKQISPAERFSVPHNAQHILLLSQPTSFFHLSIFLTASAGWFPASSWTFHTIWLWLAQLFILIYYPRIAITFFPLLSVSAPLSSAWPLNAVVSHLPNQSNVFCLSVFSLCLLWKPLITPPCPPCFTSFPFLSLSLLLSPVAALQAGFTSRDL